jgi:hypothetical protein
MSFRSCCVLFSPMYWGSESRNILLKMRSRFSIRTGYAGVLTSNWKSIEVKIGLEICIKLVLLQILTVLDRKIEFMKIEVSVIVIQGVMMTEKLSASWVEAWVLQSTQLSFPVQSSSLLDYDRHGYFISSIK